MGGNQHSKLMTQLVQLRTTAKSLKRQAAKCEKGQKLNEKKLKEAIEKGDMETAKIYAQNAIRDKNQALSYLRLSSRIEAVAQHVQTAVSMNQLTRSMGNVVKGMDKTLATMDVEKISALMDKFESNFEDLGVRTAYMDEAIDSTAIANAAPVDEVNSLMQQVAEENGLQLQLDLDEPGLVPTETHQEAETEEDDLEARFAALNS